MSQQIWWAAVNTRCHRGRLIFEVGRREKPLRRKNRLRATIHYGAWSWANYLKDSSNAIWTRGVWSVEYRKSLYVQWINIGKIRRRAFVRVRWNRGQTEYRPYPFDSSFFRTWHCVAGWVVLALQRIVVLLILLGLLEHEEKNTINF
jgi:hypothetical protein